MRTPDLFRRATALSQAVGVSLLLAMMGCANSDAKDASPKPGTTTTSRPATTGPATRKGPETRPRFLARKAERDAMVRVIQRYGLTDKTVLAAMRAVPRHEFVPPAYAKAAYADSALPIGKGQTISQPYIVAEMTRHLRLDANSRVLEVGTGSGYQAAVLAEITPHVCTIEIVKSLADSAAKRLASLGYDTVKVRHGDGYAGWKKHAPFDAIIVTCGAPKVPKPLLDQLAPGGRIVIPVGEAGSIQQLMVVEKSARGAPSAKAIMPVRFVPLTRKVR